ncbi:hypothetical protein AVEN_61864-1 [Araneus ventricosus]|uniref:Uncharacterized protein n=1 Tax=Araneus ventricosus TaxID=182803 RepID=A0A4Y1ZMN4_ARAVE|nr:hypothetical protein AVEN_61864-1 [Araneus ventricosus]
MLHTVFQNIKGLPHFSVRWRVFFNTSVPVGIINLLLGLAQRQLGKFPKSISVAATGKTSSMDIHSSYSFFCIPSGGSMTITDGHVPAR